MVRINRRALKQYQQGITLVLLSLVMLILLGMAAFGIDINNQVLNRTRLQNAVDAAALAGAVVADDSSDVDAAEAAARATLVSFVATSGNNQLIRNENFSVSNDGNTSVTFSHDLENFVDAASFAPPAGDYDIYVRVQVTGMPLTQYLAGVFGIGQTVSASAVAGRSAAVIESCNLTPIAMCGEPTGSAEDAWGYNPLGYDPNTSTDPTLVHELKVGDQDNTDMGPGNFQLLDFGQDTANSGAALVRDALSGAYNGCATIGDTVVTKPGSSVGPVAQGINTRLNDFSGPIKNDGTVLPDKYVREPDVLAESGELYAGDLYYSNYLQELSACESGGSPCDSASYTGDSGERGRRILRVPIVNCTASTGKSEFDVLGFGCFFLLQKVDNSGQAAVFGQFLYECPINNGSTGVDPTDKGFYRIQLYKDPSGGAS
ncbi:pilus assembly protein TadG-related protein [Vibrio sp. CAU 1672]|uniref:pilus assembly protein TadG-related protein n=1 Tax=Vibrio sp. CAU 1672 TaxID=3032594 RepID=UPI0023DC8C54|nr:pilus assembly protein TadG-related protein [Vibrio sp. CAU 1672]MDF2154429.1 pilus assembly protein TadG-related protein [Vibrio sp. CAU 1672]